MTLRSLTIALLAVASYATAEEHGGYLFATFRGEQSPMTEQVYFSFSRDGRTWSALQGGQPVLVSALGEKGVRDPFLMRRPDNGHFVLIATDLSIHLHPGWKRATEAGSRSIVIWDSPDLIHWSEPRLVPVAPEDAGCTWAPEAVYDQEHQEFLVFWASKTKRDRFSKHRIWSARTKDFVSFGPPTIFQEGPRDIIDTTIIPDGAGYVRFSKDEEYKAVTMERGARLEGPWTPVKEFTLANLVGYEGPTCFRLQDGSNGWCLLLDHYAKGRGYQPFTASDLAAGSFTAGQGFAFPFKFRHGTVLPVTAEESRRLLDTWGPKVP